jgi:hypothetical protein
VARSKEEHQEQVKLKNWLDILERQNKIVLSFAVPNGGSRNMLEATNLKKEGVRSGTSDYVVVGQDRVIFIEMKKKKKKLKSGKLSASGISVSDSQKEFIARVTLSDVCDGAICYGFDEAKLYIQEQLNV